MCKQSAGILAYRFRGNIMEVLLVHPGGPFFAKKDIGVWSVPKGEYEHGEDPLEVAKREFYEETGNTIDSNGFIRLDAVKNKSGKMVTVWAAEADFKQCYISSNTFELEWPPRSGRIELFPECDKAEWFNLEEAANKIYPYQEPLLEQLTKIIKSK
jgi:predicted NUDIX family NTP pyrophosphohydrolase